MAITVGPNKILFKNNIQFTKTRLYVLLMLNEFNMSQNPTIATDSSGSLRDFATGSDFMPYATTIGLYNDNNELLMVGKFGQSIPISNEIDTTFVIRYDQ
jgi:hypothetical protein